MTRRTAGFVVAGLAVALVLAVVVSRWASPDPDGLERVTADHGIDAGVDARSPAAAPLADYTAPGVDDPGTATGAAGAAGVAATFLLAGGVVWLTSRARRATRRDAPSPAP